MSGGISRGLPGTTVGIAEKPRAADLAPVRATVCPLTDLRMRRSAGVHHSARLHHSACEHHNACVHQCAGLNNHARVHHSAYRGKAN